MTTTEPAARLTVEPNWCDGWTLYSVHCRHGGFALDVHPSDKRYANELSTVRYILNEDAKSGRCHCADAIRARYGAGGA